MKKGSFPDRLQSQSSAEPRVLKRGVGGGGRGRPAPQRQGLPSAGQGGTEPNVRMGRRVRTSSVWAMLITQGCTKGANVFTGGLFQKLCLLGPGVGGGEAASLSGGWPRLTEEVL